MKLDRGPACCLDPSRMAWKQTSTDTPLSCVCLIPVSCFFFRSNVSRLLDLHELLRHMTDMKASERWGREEVETCAFIQVAILHRCL